MQTSVERGNLMHCSQKNFVQALPIYAFQRQRVCVQQDEEQNYAQGMRDGRARSRSASALNAAETHLHTQSCESILRRN